MLSKGKWLAKVVSLCFCVRTMDRRCTGHLEWGNQIVSTYGFQSSGEPVEDLIQSNDVFGFVIADGKVKVE